MSDSPFIIEVNNENFQEVVIEGSMNHLVLVDFWADWCAPCKVLIPILSKLAEEYKGQFVLAKVNSDEQQELSAQYGIRSLPTVKLFKQGKIVDEFMGAQAEPHIREQLEQHIIRESDHLHEQALHLLSQNNVDEATKLLETANGTDPGRTLIIADLARLYLQQDKLDLAQNLLDDLPQSAKESPEISGLLTSLELAQEAADLPDEAELRALIESDGNNLEARYQLATLHINKGNHEAGIQQLLDIIKRDRQFNNEAASKLLLKVFDLLGDDPLVGQYRRKMFMLLH